jgi:hypothetical protein
MLSSLILDSTLNFTEAENPLGFSDFASEIHQYYHNEGHNVIGAACSVSSIFYTHFEDSFKIPSF